MKVICRTNLDLFNEEWPTNLPAIPVVGHEIQSKTKHGHFQLSLKVVAVRWECRYLDFGNEWISVIELHMTDFQRMLPAKTSDAATGSIKAFYQWYAPLIGKTVGHFI